MRYFRWLILLVLTRGLPGRAQGLTTAQAVLDSVRQAYRLPALGAAIVAPSKVQLVLGGVRRNDQPDPVRLTDYFHIGSVTKGVTSLLAGRLVEQGKLHWDSELLAVVPELRAAALPAYTHVTLGQLLSHRAGLAPFTAGAEYQQLPNLTGSLSARRQQFAAYVLTLPPVPPAAGTAYRYSNADYVLAALMLERVSRRSWERQVRQLFRRLKLHYRLGFPNRHDPRQPWGHWRPTEADSAFVPLGPTHPYQLADYMAPAGNLAMPLPDLARLVQLHLNGLLGQANCATGATYQTLHFGLPAYAYGWGVSALAATSAPVSFHDGTAGTFFCHVILYPSQQLAFVVLTNDGDEPARRACYVLRRRLKALYLQGRL